MNAWQRLQWSVRMARRELAAGELTVLALALLVAITALASVAFFSDRLERALTREATHLLAADLVVNADAPLAPRFAEQAARRGLRVAHSASFPSMASSSEQATLATLKAVSNSYPLRGEVRLRSADGVKQGALHPEPGTAWADGRLLSRLKLRLGDSITIGGQQLRLAGELEREPDATLDLYNFVPRLLFNHADLAGTGLVQEGSRIRWRLMVAGEAAAVASYRAWASPQLPPGAHLDNVEDARPEVRVALERARRFLGLTAMLTVTLAAAAVALAVRRYLARHWQGVAVLRCLGLTSRELSGLFLGLFILLALGAGSAGTLAGFGLQELLLHWMRPELGQALPAPGLWTWLLGPLAALVLLAGLALPPLWAMRSVSPLGVLRQEVPPRQPGWLTPLAAVFALLALTAGLTADLTTASWLLGGLVAFLALVGLVALLVLGVVRWLGPMRRIGWGYGVANLGRRPWLAVIQLVSLSVGLMALLTLTVVRADLMGAWQQSVPPDAPNRFIINIQPSQIEAVRDVFALEARPQPELLPMIRGRLVAINGKPVRPAAFADDRARRLAEREFNLSWRDAPPPGNRISAGQWWNPQRAKPQFSVEQGLAKTLGIRMGDTLSFNVAGSTHQARVTSLREVQWDSFRVNFFVIAPERWLGGQPASYITSFRLEPAEEAFVTRLLERFPNLTVIDVGAILTQVQGMVERLARATEAMFSLALVAGVLVLWAALATTRDERLFDVGLMRALGASRRQLALVVYSELAWLGALAGLLAGIGAMALGAVVADRLLNLPLLLNWSLPLLGCASGVLVVTLTGWPLLRRVTRTPPMLVLNNA